MVNLLAALSRGALPVLDSRLASIDPVKEENIAYLGEQFSNLEPQAKQLVSEAKKNNANIQKLATMYNVDPGIVAPIYEITGGNLEKTEKRLSNMISAYSKNEQGIPTIDTPTTSTVIDEVQPVNIVDKDASDDSKIQSFANLFRHYGPDEIVKVFAKRRGLSEDYVRKIISGTFEGLLPETQYDVRPTDDAMLKSLIEPQKINLKDENQTSMFMSKKLFEIASGPNGSERFNNSTNYNLSLTIPNALEKAINSGNPEEIKVVTETIKNLQASIIDKPTEIKKVTVSDKVPVQYQSLPGLIEELVKKTKNPNSGFTDEPTVNKINNLQDTLTLILEQDKGSKNQLTLLENATLLYQQINPEAPVVAATSYEQRVNNLIEARIAGGDTRPRDTIKQDVVMDIEHGIIDVGGGNKARIIIGEGGVTTVELIKRFNDFGFEVPFKPDDEKANIEIINTSTDAFLRMASLRNTLFKDPNALNIFGKVRMKVTDIGEMTGLIEGSALGGFFNNRDIQRAQQAAIEFFKDAKDQIFKDPRISDQDKALIERYIAIIDDPTASRSRALAALIGLERKSSLALALAIADNNRQLNIIELTEDGVLDVTEDSVATQVFNTLLATHGYSVEDYKNNKYNAAQQKVFLQTANNFMELAKQSVFPLAIKKGAAPGKVPTYRLTPLENSITFGPIPLGTS